MIPRVCTPSFAVLLLLGACSKQESKEIPLGSASTGIMAGLEEAADMAPTSETTTLAPPAPMHKSAVPGAFGGRNTDDFRGSARKRKKEASKGDLEGEVGGKTDKSAADPQHAQRPRPKRMVHYNGFLRLRVTNPTQSLQQASEIADTAGGYVESLTATSVTLRIPVAKFRETFTQLAKIGEVLSRSMSAQDVTDAFVATELRAKTLRASRDRLIALLGRAQKAREKLQLLREIQRLTEEIDQLEMQLTTLKSLAELSRLTVEVVPHQMHVDRQSDEPIASFRWIYQLSPFRRDIAEMGDRLKLQVPTGFVALSDTDQWIAESADGAVIWASRHEVEPVGTTDFWLQAIRSRLEKEFASAKISAVGDFQMIRMVDQSEAAYRYLVGVRNKDGKLDLVEVYYPSADHEKRYGDGVRSVIERGRP